MLLCASFPTSFHFIAFVFASRLCMCVCVGYSALPKGAYVEDRILQRRERRLASPGKYK